MKRIVNNICVILIFAIFAGLVIVRNVQYRAVPVVVERGSYADTFADEKHLPKAEITDDLKNELDIRYEGEQAEIPDCPFGYNVVNNEIELIYYYGTEKRLIIPSHIAGYPVTKVAFDLVGNYDAVVIPATVESITGKVSDVLYTPVFFIEMIFSVLAFMLVLICNNVFLPRLKNEKEFLLSGSQIVSSLLYLTVQLLFAVLSIYHYVSVSNYTALVVSAVLLIGYILAMMLSGTGRSHIEKVGQKTELRTEFMKNFSRECMNLSEGIKDREVKKQVDRLVEDIRFSDKVSSAELMDIEEELELKIKELRVAISGGDPENIMSACKKAKNALDERNRMTKAVK